MARNKDFVRGITTIIAMVVLTGIVIFCSKISGKINSDYSSDVRIMGTDVSHHQEEIDWDKFVKFHGDSIKFVYIKATEGATYVDPRYKTNIIGAKKAGFKVGVYHYFRTTSSAEKQFDNFKKNVNRKDLDLIPMVDVEECDYLSIKELKSELRKFIKLIEDEYNTPVMIYGTNRSYNSFCAPDFNDYALMIGRHGPKEPKIKGNGNYTIWQFSRRGTFKGITQPADIDVLNSNKSMEDILIPAK